MVCQPSSSSLILISDIFFFIEVSRLPTSSSTKTFTFAYPTTTKNHTIETFWSKMEKSWSMYYYHSKVLEKSNRVFFFTKRVIFLCEKKKYTAMRFSGFVSSANYNTKQLPSWPSRFMRWCYCCMVV